MQQASTATVTSKISCVECRRLKRKCDRVHPCEQCKRYGKTCVFPEPETPKRGRKYIAEVEGRVEHLERLLAEHAPHVQVNEAAGEEDELRRRPPLQSRLSHERGLSKMSPHSPVMDTSFFSPHDQQPNQSTDMLLKRTSSNSGGRPSTIHPSMSPVSVSPIGMFDPPSLTDSAASAPRARMPPPPLPISSGPFAAEAAPPPTAADAYERQPRNAAGYEWDETRRGTALANDGTASLSVEPDGEGYLGFAAGSTLLRILQITAGGVSLAHLPVHDEQTAPGNWHPAHAQIQRYVESYFEHYHTQYPIIHEGTFRAQFAEVIPQPPRKQWLLLVNAVVGLGAFCCSQPMYVVDYFLDRAVSVITAEHLETGSLTLVQAFILLSNLTQKRNKPNAGSTYLGIAVRMAMSLGLHRELPLWNIKPFEREVRRRVWWVTFIFDAGASVTFGRPILLPYGSADVKMVHNVQDRDFTPSAPSVPPATTDTTVYTSLIYQASFHLTANRCYERVISTPPPSAEEVWELDQDLRHWHASIPKWMTSPYVNSDKQFADTPWLHFSAHKLFWRYCNLRIILHRRAFLERALQRLPLSTISDGPGIDLELSLSSLCLQNAFDTICDIHDFFRGRSLNALEKWYGLHFIFQSSFVPLIALRTDASSPDRSTWQEAVRLACNTLHTVKGDPLADRCLRIIDLLTPSVPEASTEVNSLLESLQANPIWQGAGPELAQNLLPFADLATLMSLWPPAA